MLTDHSMILFVKQKIRLVQYQEMNILVSYLNSWTFA